MPTKRLTESANLDHLKHQAKDLLRDFRAGEKHAYQRLREFHPKLVDITDSEMSSQTFSLSDAQLSIAREYGYASWPRLKTVLAEKQHKELQLSHNDRLPDGPFKQALDFMDDGDEARLVRHLEQYPALIHQTAQFEGGNYFSNPTLLEFLPENPFRNEVMPKNAVRIAEILLEAGAKRNQTALNETVGLAASGRICRECGVQAELIKLLCRYGADPATAMHSALAHLEFEAARELLECGAPLTLTAAATLGDAEAVARLLKDGQSVDLQLALSLSANAGRSKIVSDLLAAGANPDQYNPPGGHSHCTPLHSAVASDQFDTVVALVEGNADLSIEDIHNGATALDWAVYMRRSAIAAFLRSQA
ncbi:Ankyrin repeat-containing protein [Epibacterium ulvae]|uniref:Ankyrin repeat-containing protein n=1 Tax=Epibacterium ulvae TaxID=1156985 RepID=A0A1G5RK47_9RHOB|nr:ankyrin repeat domain-containing protein [Epibacterium ulvae]SCZ74248.1 Ankyrin repeat-containing protein [Epibacterium ulvae]